MKFRFTAENSGASIPSGKNYIADENDMVITIRQANAILEAEEAKCKKVYGHYDNTEWHIHHGPTEVDRKYYTSALLWNVEKIEEGEK